MGQIPRSRERILVVVNYYNAHSDALYQQRRVTA